MTARVYIVINLLLLTGFSSCDRMEHPTHYLDSDFSNFVMFQQNSYWVYNQEGSNRLDSVFLYTHTRRINDTRRAYSFNYEEFFQNMYSSYYQDTLLGSGGAAISSQESIYFIYTTAYLSSYLDRNLEFYSMHAVGTNLELTETLKVKYSDSLATYFINGHNFSDVKIFESTVIRDPLMTKRVYYARGVGVIRKELFNGQVWNLLRYKVNQ